MITQFECNVKNKQTLALLIILDNRVNGVIWTRNKTCNWNMQRSLYFHVQPFYYFTVYMAFKILQSSNMTARLKVYCVTFKSFVFIDVYT